MRKTWKLRTPGKGINTEWRQDKYDIIKTDASHPERRTCEQVVLRSPFPSLKAHIVHAYEVNILRLLFSAYLLQR